MRQIGISGASLVATTGRFIRGTTSSHVAASAAFLVSSAWAADEIARVQSTTVSIPTSADWQKFLLLVRKWRKERGITSSVTKMVLCPSYQRIIAMGDKAVPFILRTMQDEGNDPDHWFWALEMITGEDPVPVNAYGDTAMMAKAWLDWAKGRYVW